MSVDKSVALLHVADYFKYLERLAIGALMPNKEGTESGVLVQTQYIIRLCLDLSLTLYER